MRVVVLEASDALRVTVSMADVPRAQVEARVASFSTGLGLIEVSAVSGDLRITLPVGAAAGSVEIEGIEVVRLEDGELRRTQEASSSPAEIIVQTGG